jgi:hypothetical protein
MFGSRIGGARAVMGLVALAWPVAAGAQGGPPGGPGFGPWNDPTKQWERELAQARGFLIVDGEEVPLPCRMVIEEDQLKINDHVVTSHLASDNADDQKRGRVKEGKIKSRPAAPYARFAAIGLGQTIVQSLGGGHLVVALADQPLLTLTDSQAQHDMLRVLAKSDSARITPASFSQRLPPGAVGARIVSKVCPTNIARRGTSFPPQSLTA